MEVLVILEPRHTRCYPVTHELSRRVSDSRARDLVTPLLEALRRVWLNSTATVKEGEENACAG